MRPPPPYTLLQFDREGTQLALIAVSHVRVLDLRTRAFAPRSAAMGEWCAAHSQPLRAAAFTRDGELLAVGGDDKELSIWKTADLSLVSVFRGRKRFGAALFDAQRRLVTADYSGDICVAARDQYMSAGTAGEMLAASAGHYSVVTAMTMSPDDKYLVTGDRDEKIRVSRYPFLAEIQSYCLGHSQLVSQLVALPRDLLVSGGLDGSVRLWQMSTGKMLDAILPLQGDAKAETPALFDPETVDQNAPVVRHIQRVATRDDAVIVAFDKHPRLFIYTVVGEALRAEAGELLAPAEVTALATHPVHNTVWVGTADGALTVYAAPEGSLAFAPAAAADLPCSLDEAQPSGDPAPKDADASAVTLAPLRKAQLTVTRRDADGEDGDGDEDA